MTHPIQRLRGWQTMMYALFLGPFFLALYFLETRRTYPAVRYMALTGLAVMVLCAYLMVTFTFNPFNIRIAYLVLFMSLVGGAWFYCWGVDVRAKSPTAKPKPVLSFSRAGAWMVVMGLLFLGLNNITQAIYFWLLGEHVAVFFSPHANIFQLWMLVGLIYGFFYGIRIHNDYFDRHPMAVVKSTSGVFVFILLYSGFILALAVYPLQRLGPISYEPQFPEYLFFFFLLVAISLSSIHLLGSAHRHGWLTSAVIFFGGIPLVVLHVVVISAYTTTISLTAASILEDRQQLPAAKRIYASAIPFIRHDDLLAALTHRQGILHVLNQDYGAAVTSFKKVLADYSEEYEAFGKARRYMDAYATNRSGTDAGRTVLVLKHRTFEQAASCFPNSLAVILSFYQNRPVGTRALSYAIKEDFASGTFTWKAEAFLAENGYDLLTTYWQNRQTLISLIDAGYPVLVYIPGHVYTVYGYDERMEIFFTYDTAHANRWNDTPFWTLQRDWMAGSFLLSVVVPKERRREFDLQFPQLERYRPAYQLWQKAHLSGYYESRGNYWKDYDRYTLSEAFGLDRLKMNESYFLDDDFFPFSWDAGMWNREVQPVLSQSWALDWNIVQPFIVYLLDNGQPEAALAAIDRYRSHRSEESAYSPFSQLLELELAAAADAGDMPRVASVSDKLIGITDSYRAAPHWGHYVKARGLAEKGNLNAAAGILIPALNELWLGSQPPSGSFKALVGLLSDIHQRDPSLLTPDKQSLLRVACIDLAVDH